VNEEAQYLSVVNYISIGIMRKIVDISYYICISIYVDIPMKDYTSEIPEDEQIESKVLNCKYDIYRIVIAFTLILAAYYFSI
jgi:hypothetical protein